MKKKILDHGHGPWHCMIKFRVIFGNLSTLTTGTYLYLSSLWIIAMCNEHATKCL
jgi:hypothetical protein